MPLRLATECRVPMRPDYTHAAQWSLAPATARRSSTRAASPSATQRAKCLLGPQRAAPAGQAGTRSLQESVEWAVRGAREEHGARECNR